MTQEKHTHLSQLSIERYLLEELDNEGRAMVEEAVDVCPDCASRLAETRADDQAFALKPVPKEIREMWTTPQKRSIFAGWFARVAVAAPVAAAAALALILWRPGADTIVQDEYDIGLPGQRPETEVVTGMSEVGEITATKLSLGFYIDRGEKPQMGEPGQTLSEGDKIEFWYNAPKNTPGILVGIDGKGVVSTYLKGSKGEGENLNPGSKEDAPHTAIQLDDTRGAERFFLCAKDGIKVEEVEAAARKLVESGADLSATEKLPLDCRQASTWIVKE